MMNKQKKKISGQLEFLPQNKLEKLPFDDVYEENGKAYYVLKDDNGEELKTICLGNCITADYVLTDIDTSLTIIILNNGKNLYELQPSKLTPNDMLQLADYGFNVVYGNAKGYFHYISNLKSVAPKKYFHSCLGWRTLKGKKIFEFDNIITKNKLMKSQYKGDFDLSKKGDLQAWIDGINQLVIGNIGLELALISSACAVINGYIGKEIGLTSFITHLVGRSSVGKTSAEKVAMSFNVNPMPGQNNSLFNTWSGTENSLIKLLSSNYGVLLTFDDTSNANTENFIDLIYLITSNVEKRRLNSSGKQIKPDSWHTVVLSSGESPLVTEKNHKDGWKVRYIEIEEQFTNSAAHADEINTFVLENYGTAIQPFVQHLLNKGSKKVIKNFNYYFNKIHSKLDEGKYNERLSKIYALYLVSAFYMNQCFDLKINKKRLINYFVDYHNQNKIQGDPCIEAYDYITEQIAFNLSHFIYDDEYNFQKSNLKNLRNHCFGKVTKYKKYHEVAIIRSKCDELLTNGGFGNLKDIYKYFKQNEFIETDKDLFTKRKMIFTNRIPCVVFLFKDDDIPTFKTYLNTRRKIKPNTKQISLDDDYDL